MDTGQTQTLPQPPGIPVERSVVQWSADGGSLYWLTDRDSDFLYLAKYDLATGTETKLTGKTPWGAELFTLTDDATLAVLLVNEDGRTRLLIVDLATGQERPAPRLAEGKISAVMFRRGSHEFAFDWSCASRRRASIPMIWRLAFRPSGSSPSPSMRCRIHSRVMSSSATPPSTGVRSRRLSAARARGSKGARPVLVLIHGGPAAHYSPGFSLLENYLLGELGIALVMPNVRGSTGYGRSYERLDDGRSARRGQGLGLTVGLDLDPAGPGRFPRSRSPAARTAATWHSPRWPSTATAFARHRRRRILGFRDEPEDSNAPPQSTTGGSSTATRIATRKPGNSCDPSHL